MNSIGSQYILSCDGTLLNSRVDYVDGIYCRKVAEDRFLEVSSRSRAVNLSLIVSRQVLGYCLHKH